MIWTPAWLIVAGVGIADHNQAMVAWACFMVVVCLVATLRSI